MEPTHHRPAVVDDAFLRELLEEDYTPLARLLGPEAVPLVRLAIGGPVEDLAEAMSGENASAVRHVVLVALVLSFLTRGEPRRPPTAADAAAVVEVWGVPALAHVVMLGLEPELALWWRRQGVAAEAHP